MATHKSAIKRARQNNERRARNRALRTRVKNVEKRVHTALEDKSPEEARQALQEAIPVIARAASKGGLHQRTASRKISALSKKVHSLGVRQE